MGIVTANLVRDAGVYQIARFQEEQVRAFVPHPLPPRNPPLVIEGDLAALHAKALSAVGRLAIASEMVPSAEWLLYGFVRKEAVMTSQIEGTEATLTDVVMFEATREAENPEDVGEVCNYVDALWYARREVARPRGLPLSARLLCEAHRRLMKGARGADKQPGKIRRSQNWIGGSRPGTARFVPPPPELVPDAMAALERWLHAKDPLPPLVRAGLAHVQFEMIHPFLDGNGRIGRMLAALLVEHWGLIGSPLLYLSVAIRRQQWEYYERLAAVTSRGDWEGWTLFFLRCVEEAADDGVAAAKKIFQFVGKDRQKLLGVRRATMSTVRLFDLLPSHPVITLARTVKLLKTTKPTASKAIATLVGAGILREITGKKRDRVYSYRRYLEELARDAG